MGLHWDQRSLDGTVAVNMTAIWRERAEGETQVTWLQVLAQTEILRGSKPLGSGRSDWVDQAKDVFPFVEADILCQRKGSFVW
ncbi:hypothetical protein GB937_000228 [Aspergillus fischeri]|nr:hypothetical protein GB937_000228 [Aspergillus fischeri]